MAGISGPDTDFTLDPATGVPTGVRQRDGKEYRFGLLTPAQVAAGATQAVGMKGDGTLVGPDGSPVSGVASYRGQIPVGTFGDSIANITSYAQQDLRRVNGAPGLAGERMAPHLVSASNGAIRIVFNGGVSGDSTALMLARDAAGATATRKAITDAVTSGVRYLVNSIGINDGQALASSATGAQITAAVAASVTNAKAILRRQVAMGIIPITPALLGYRYEPTSALGTNDAAKVAVVQQFVREWNTAMSAAVTAAGVSLGYWVDDFLSRVVDSAGAWRAGRDQGDGLHPGYAACEIIYGSVAALICRIDGTSTAIAAALPAGANLFANADFSASSGGLATGLNAYASAGTATATRQIIEWRGQMWQEWTVTPTALDVNGNVGWQIDATWTSAAIASGDVLGGELSLYVDDGAGGAPAGVFQSMTRMRANTVYVDLPLFNPTISPKVPSLSAIDRRFVSMPIISPAAAPATSFLSVVLVSQTLTPFRVRIARPRVVKLPATY